MINQAPSQLLLALDTASDQIALALGDAKKANIIATADSLARRQANSSLLPAIKALLERENAQQKDIVKLVVGLGPGSFTGVRIGVATAKGIAAGLNVPLYGLSTLDAVAWQAWLAGIRGVIGVVADAMRGEVYPARFELSAQGAKRLDAHSVAKASQVAVTWGDLQPQLLGDGLVKFREAFSDFTVLPEELWRPTGAGLLQAFFAARTAGTEGSGDAAALLPVYTRLSDAEENERRRLASTERVAQGALLEALPEKATYYRPMSAKDVRQVAALEAASFSEPHDAWSPQMVLDELAHRDRSCWVACQNKVVVGYASGQIIAERLTVLRLAVSLQARRQGIASKLLFCAIEDARSLGASEISLEVRASNSDAQALYRSLGLAEVGRRPRYYSAPNSSLDSADREDAIIMSGPLPPPPSLLPSPSPLLPPPSLLSPLPLLPPPLPPLAEAQPDEAQPATKELPLPRAPVLSEPKSSATVSPLRILAIETSCDETAAAVISGEGTLLANVIASQVDFHHRFGGVVPEIASRKHTEAIASVVEQALQEANTPLCDLNAIAVTYAPGLIGALVVGVAYAKGLSWAAGLPLILVNHLEGHIYANKLAKITEADNPTRQQRDSETPLLVSTPDGHPNSRPASLSASQSSPQAQLLTPPFVVALLSGGTTMLVHVRAWGDYRVMGQTLDDAVGEAFDKVAKALGLGYPGGPAIAKLAEAGDPQAINFPRALLHSHGYDFSLSGLKTAVITWIRQQLEAGVQFKPANVAASFEQAVIEVQVAKALAACKEAGVTKFCIGGGVAANQALRAAFKHAMASCSIEVVYPPAIACTDIAAMIALVALDRYAQGRFAGLAADAQASANLEQPY